MSKVIGFYWHTRFLGVAVSTLAILFSNVAHTADNVGGLLSEKLKKFTPPDLAVTIPAGDVPKECAAFIGEWGPSSISRTSTAVKIVVESVTTDCTIKVVLVWAEPPEFPTDPRAGWMRHNSKIVRREFEIPGISGGSTWVFKMSSPATEMEVVATNAKWQSVRFTISR